MNCPLCLAASADFFCEKKFKWGLRRWVLCSGCDLVFVHPDDRPTKDVEHGEYQLHNNHHNDTRYVEQLMKLKAPLETFLPPGCRGLDYGSGPTPVLSEIFARQGFVMEIYDPFFAAKNKVLDQKYDFITCTEVVEHFFNPCQEFKLLVDHLEAEGHLGVMTSPRHPHEDFLMWPYIREKSHVSFYSNKCMDWIAEHFNLQTKFHSESVWIWTRRA